MTSKKRKGHKPPEEKEELQYKLVSEHRLRKMDLDTFLKWATVASNPFVEALLTLLSDHFGVEIEEDSERKSIDESVLWHLHHGLAHSPSVSISEVCKRHKHILHQRQGNYSSILINEKLIQQSLENLIDRGFVTSNILSRLLIDSLPAAVSGLVTEYTQQSLVERMFELYQQQEQGQNPIRRESQLVALAKEKRNCHSSHCVFHAMETSDNDEFHKHGLAAVWHNVQVLLDDTDGLDASLGEGSYWCKFPNVEVLLLASDRQDDMIPSHCFYIIRKRFPKLKLVEWTRHVKAWEPNHDKKSFYRRAYYTDFSTDTANFQWYGPEK